MRVAICATQVPYVRGGAEIHVETLRQELVRRAFDAEVISLPFSCTTRVELLKSSLAWRLIDLKSGDGVPIDLVIATRFPSYLIEHPNKVVWLIHQFRQAYELVGTRFSDFGQSDDDREVLSMIRAMDYRTLSEARALFSNARNTAERLKRFNDLEATPLYPPPKLIERYHHGEFGDYLFAVGRLDPIKRFDLLIRAMEQTRSGARCLIAGEGNQRPELERMIRERGLERRVELLGFVSDERLIELYAGCFAVCYAPYDEDFGYVTIEAFKSGKPVITADDSGGVLEFAADGENGYVCPSGSPGQFGRRIDALYEDRELARRLGQAGERAVVSISWDHVIRSLTGKTRADE